MTTGEMLGWTNRFKEIMSAPKKLRSKRLANLMTDLEIAYKIPMLQSNNFHSNNGPVMQLYRTVSEARGL